MFSQCFKKRFHRSVFTLNCDTLAAMFAACRAPKRCTSSNTSSIFAAPRMQRAHLRFTHYHADCFYSGVTVHDAPKITQNAVAVRNLSQIPVVSKAPPLKPSRPRPHVSAPKRKLKVQQVSQEALHLILPHKLADLEKLNDAAITTYALPNHICTPHCLHCATGWLLKRLELLSQTTPLQKQF